MTLHADKPTLDWPQVAPLSAADLAEFKQICTAIAAGGGECGAIANDMLRVSERLSVLKDEVEAFLERTKLS